MASPKMSLKLLLDRKGSRVLFAEAPKEFVDFLFHIFSLPLGTLIDSMGSNQMVGCLGNLKDSIESFHGAYLQPDIKIDDIFNPNSTFNGNTFLLSYDADASSEDQSEAVYRCENATRCSYYSKSTHRVEVYPFFGSPIRRKIECSNTCCKLNNATLYANSICPQCGGIMNAPMTVVIPNEVLEARNEDKKNKGGYAKEVVTYMVMDDLVVKPMSTISSITLINNLGVKDLSLLEEKMVTFGKYEAWRLYKEGKTSELIDAALHGSCNVSEVLRSIQVGLLCVQQHANDRPTMLSVVLMLVSESVLPQPKQPAFFTGESDNGVQSMSLVDEEMITQLKTEDSLTKNLVASC